MRKLGLLFALLVPLVADALVANSDPTPVLHRSNAKWDLTELDENMAHWVDKGIIPKAWQTEVTAAHVQVDSWMLVHEDKGVIAAGSAANKDDMEKATHIEVKYKIKVGQENQRDGVSMITKEKMAQVGVNFQAKTGVDQWWQAAFDANADAKVALKNKVQYGISSDFVAALTADISMKNEYEGVLNAGVKGELFAGGKAGLAFTVDFPKGEFKFGGSAFAGVEAVAKGECRWFSLQLKAKFGVGATCEVKHEDGEVTAELGAALGPGGGFAVSINVAQIAKDLANKGSFLSRMLLFMPKPPGPCSILQFSPGLYKQRSS